MSKGNGKTRKTRTVRSLDQRIADCKAVLAALEAKKVKKDREAALKAAKEANPELAKKVRGLQQTLSTLESSGLAGSDAAVQIHDQIAELLANEGVGQSDDDLEQTA